MKSLLQVRDLTVRYSSQGTSEVCALDGVTFNIGPGEAVGILGESGCGKTTLALALLCLLPPVGRIVRGSVWLGDRDLLNLSEKELQKIRGAEVSMIFQEPGIALNPVLRVGEQIREVLRAHRPWSLRRRREETRRLLEEVGLSEVARIEQSYPHELSGGQRQRVVIAQAIACRPAVLIADEPTTALDATLQAQILTLLKDLKERLAMALVLISHTPAVLAKLVDRVFVMYAGRLVEEGPAAQMFAHPLHPYTRGLLQCLPERGAQDGGRGTPFPTIPGSPPDLAHLPKGCPFEPRCPDRMETCGVREPEEFDPEPSCTVRCFKYGG